MEKVTFKFDLGSKVTDSINGITGVIDAVLLKKNKSRQYSVQPKSVTGDARLDAWFLDEDQLVLVDEVLAKKDSREVVFEFCPGSKAKDKVSGITGIIIYAIHWINGCTSYTIQPKAKKGATKKPEHIVCDQDDVELIEEKKVTENVEKKHTGGPAMKSNSLRL